MRECLTDPWLSESAAAEVSGLSVRRLQALADAGAVKTTRDDGSRRARRLYCRADLLRAAGILS